MDLPPALTLDQLRTAIQAKTVDTVVLALTDMQGRLQGKRLTAPHFLDTVLQHGSEACNYLLAVDVEMNTVDGYAMSSWERGYGDFELVPDLGTLRRIPWLEGTALVLCDVAWGDGSPKGEELGWKLVHFIRHLPRLTPDEIGEMEGLNPQ